MLLGMTIGTGSQRSSRSAFGRSTGNDVSGHYKRNYFLFWREHVAFQQSAFRQSTAGNDVVATIVISLFFFSPGGHIGFCRRCGVACGKRVPPSPLGWYFLNYEAHPRSNFKGEMQRGV